MRTRTKWVPALPVWTSLCLLRLLDCLNLLSQSGQLHLKGRSFLCTVVVNGWALHTHALTCESSSVCSDYWTEWTTFRTEANRRRTDGPLWAQTNWSMAVGNGSHYRNELANACLDYNCSEETMESWRHVHFNVNWLKFWSNLWLNFLSHPIQSQTKTWPLRSNFRGRPRPLCGSQLLIANKETEVDLMFQWLKNRQ